ncbi:conjugal transfer protein TraH [Novacetimonas maltaceti]|nr:type IV secretion system protein [Novacetimonas maltaceti]PYD58201.1 conjugal transfer protein TraH [Novacetimonas maltaceti]
MTTPFEDFDTSLRTAFSTGTSNVISQGLSAVASTFTALIVLWVIVQGVLVMRGDLDARRGISRIIRVTLVSAFILEAGIYNGYVVNLFQTVLPTWAASSVSSSTASTPKLLDDIWNSLVNYSATIDKQLHWFQVVDLIELAMIAIADGAMLTIAFAIYICSSLMTAVILSLGPFVIAGFLFDATRNISERWVGKLVGLALLSLLVDVTMIIVATGIRTYMLACNLNAVSAAGTPGIAIQIMEQTAMFIAVSTFILISLPAAAAFIGGGVSLNPAGAILNTIIGGATGGVGTVAKAGANIGRKSSNK